jgi:hypothetical protein
MTREALIGELLTRLEREEVRLMEWGFFDIAHTGEEVAGLFRSDPVHGESFSQLVADGEEALFVDDLASAGLLYRLGSGFPPTYRSRFAESARLLVRLRQRFNAEDWLTAPELVSEARFHLAPRRFPVRNIDFDGVWSTLESRAWRASVQRAALEALMAHADKPLMFANFQLRAAERILRHFRGTEGSAGTVVTAGTGGGKTKAFYIPAFMGIAAEIAQDPRESARVLSIYPRNVLLADQFSEAIGQAMLVNRHLGVKLKRPIRVGALVGDVPLNANFERDFRNKWALEAWPRPPKTAGHLVPHLRDPGSGEALVWLDTDRRAGRTTLRFASEPDRVAIPDGVVVLTRADMFQRPPDVVLTSIEMINKELSSEFGREVLGFGTANPTLRLILLDEIHTYEGLTGAQVPWILRRLSYWTRGARRGGTAVHVVGLSATLQDASAHLATLTGVPDHLIVEICPDASSDELTIEGQEYNVVLKSHPGSGAGVLATSIQSVMLGARLLTPQALRPAMPGVINASYFFGSKLFGFTDNLDVVNRWLPDFCDAEQIKKLARFRARRPNDDARWQAGQAWRLTEDLHHNLQLSLRVGRTSSQDPGVDAQADVVLATSALEVGFDDDQVGMVVQHKAPRSAASFLQRKGRAGRRKGMRPWTVVVLSEHGRDRWAYRDSEHLFSPHLDRLSLPVFNPYVLRIQSTWFLVDWIAKRVGQGVPSLYLVRKDYSNPRANEIVRRLIDDPLFRDQLTRDMAEWFRHAQDGVRMSDPEALARDILWKPPRAVLRQVVPVLWNHLEEGSGAIAQSKRLLPQFLPERTWDVLDTQDVELAIAGTSNPQSMDVRRALRECIPGRVSRRYAVGKKEQSKWLASSPLLLEAPSSVDISADRLISEFTTNCDLPGLCIYQPTRLEIADVPVGVKKSSNAEWEWSLNVLRTGQAEQLTLHTGPLAKSFIEGSVAWLHRERSWLRTYRYATSVRYEVLLDKGVAKRGVVIVSGPSNDVQAAVGYVRAVDGIELSLRRDVVDSIVDPISEVSAALRPSFLRYLAMRSEILRRKASTFSINLLVTSSIGMVAATALRNQVKLEDAWSLISNKAVAAGKVLQSVLAGEVEIDPDSDVENRGSKEVFALWSDAEVASEMDRLVAVLWQEPDERWREWLRGIFLETIRSAIEVAVQSLLPEVPDNDFSVEVIDEAQATSILILEADAGGVGIIERLIAEISSDASLFDTAVEAALSQCRSERLTDNSLHALRQIRRQESDLGAAFRSIRQAGAYGELQSALEVLVHDLATSGCDADKEAVTALAGKVLMPGSSPATDRWIRVLTDGRKKAERRISMAIDTRLWAYWTVSSVARRRRLSETLRAMHGQAPSDAQLTGAARRMTLDPCRDACPECLGTGKEMRGIIPSRRLARQWLNLTQTDRVIRVDDASAWVVALDEALLSDTRIRLRFSDAQKNHVSGVLVGRLAQPYDRGFALAGFRIVSTSRIEGGWEAQLRVDDLEVD